MAEFLYTDFLENKRVYNLAQAYWGRLLTGILKQHGYSHIPYINQLQGGKKEYDGNPIFSAYIPEAGCAIRIIQASPEEEGNDISAWIDTIELNGKIKAGQARELVLDVKLSSAAKSIAKRLMAKWITIQLDESALDELIAKASRE